MGDGWINQLHYGDNLEVLREKVADESVDLIYLDPPFNSQRNYNLLFKQVKGDAAPAQIMAFEDTWQWSPKLYNEFMEDTRNAKLFDLVDALYKILGDSEMMAYVVMMAPRVLELHRKLKPTGSLYLHCDPVASHYLKIMLDTVFGPANFRNEIIWKRTTAKALASIRLPRNHDVVLNYAKTIDQAYWDETAVFQAYDHDDLDAKTAAKYSLRDKEGRRYQLTDLTNPNPNRPNLTYEFLGITKVWRWTRERMQAAYDRGLVIQPRPGAVPRYKRYLDEQRGKPLDDVWIDIPPINSQSKERRGYPTQKPLTLLERVIEASTKEGDVVLDPFCGCGTAVVAAQRMGRKWIGIDVTYLAIAEIVYRLSTETEAVRDVDYKLIGAPRDEMSARKFFEQTAPQNHKPFEMWGVHLVEGEPQEKKGSDKGIDGRIPFRGLDKKLRWGLIQVKGGGTGPTHVRDFARTLDRDNALLGLFICFHKTKEMQEEAEKMGNAETIGGSRKVPRLQIMTVKDLLEDKKRFEIPEGWRLPRSKGVGKVSVRQEALALDEDDAEEPDSFEEE